MMRSHERVTSALLQTLPLAGFHRVSHRCCGGAAAWQTASKALKPSANTLKIWLLPTTMTAWKQTCPRRAQPAAWGDPEREGPAKPRPDFLIHRNYKMMNVC